MTASHAQSNCQNTNLTGIATQECEALLSFYHSSNGEQWLKQDNWNTTEACSNWYGLEVEDGHVISIELEANNLTGILTPDLAMLPQLSYLSLSENRITGTIPPELGTLSALSGLYLSGNQFEGEFPLQLTDLSQLLSLYVSDNQLTGLIPPELSTLPKLRYLRLNNNLFHGEIPKELAQIQTLKTLALYDNLLTGSIPRELALLENLEFLLLFNNRLTGEIPAELGQLNKLQWLDLEVNQLSGEIPPELGNLSSLTRLDLDHNLLVGTLPIELAKLSNLTDLYIKKNQLTGILPPEYSQMTKLKKIYLQSNDFTGPLPEQWSSMQDLLWLNLSDNHFTGTIPQTFSQLSKLERLYLANNQLTGILPVELMQLTALEAETGFNIARNALFTTDPQLQDFITQKSTTWLSMQAIAPSDISVLGVTGSSVTLSWTAPNSYAPYDGFYRIQYATEPGGPYLLNGGSVTNKRQTTHTINNLLPETSYYFVLETYTLPNEPQRNTIISASSSEVNATTPSLAQIAGNFHIAALTENTLMRDLSFHGNMGVFDVNNEGGLFSLSVQREGDLTGSASIDYYFTPATADEGDDFLSQTEDEEYTATLLFAAGEQEKSVQIQIIDDGEAEESEYFRFFLSNPSTGMKVIDDTLIFHVLPNELRPEIETEETEITMYPGQLRSLIFNGGTGKRLIHQPSDPDILETKDYDGGDILSLIGKQVGSTQIILEDENTPPELIQLNIVVAIQPQKMYDPGRPDTVFNFPKNKVDLIQPMYVPDTDDAQESLPILFVIKLGDRFLGVKNIATCQREAGCPSAYQLSYIDDDLAGQMFFHKRVLHESLDFSEDLSNVSGFDLNNLDLSSIDENLSVDVFMGYGKDNNETLIWTWYQVNIHD
ncbi:Calx-beta domain-containing protein [Candidatus Venteria ishoeyi]|uniref:Calx-beta domain-containing protein n=1 Tax=Candidatus Venteria ishoeyi TaxID=1899563 RepID=UPI0025A50EFD|nr:Calx-beta domain-containing protein [Candidatus Venteria ishoeyi]MDM8544906.1 Calx-beta domain-containing protein [Candidatus Venteria ishoeyi]